MQSFTTQLLSKLELGWPDLTTIYRFSGDSDNFCEAELLDDCQRHSSRQIKDLLAKIKNFRQDNFGIPNIIAEKSLKFIIRDKRLRRLLANIESVCQDKALLCFA